MPNPAPIGSCNLHTCDRCEDTALCADYELTRDYKWKWYAKRTLLLCPDCQPSNNG